MHDASIEPQPMAFRFLPVLALLLIITLSVSIRLVSDVVGLASVAPAAPALNGAAAVEYLKAKGLYSALASAFEAARRSELADDDPNCGYVERQHFSASDGSNGDRFGQSLAVDGDTVVVGVPYDALGAVANQGTAYVFVRNGERWQERARLFPSDGAPDDHFGISVAISGNTIVVGAPGNNIGAVTDQGAAYVFVNNTGSWFEQQRLLANDGAGGDVFGQAVAISGDLVAVGALGADIDGKQNQGAVYRFRRSGTVWTQEDKLTAEDGAAGDLFGSSVALTTSVLLVGAPEDDIESNVDQGSAYLFGDSVSILTPYRKLIASDGAAGDRFGSAVAFDGGTALVGAPYDDNRRGSAYVFVRGGTRFLPLWIFQGKLAASNPAVDDFFGQSVALQGDRALVGAAQIIGNGKADLFLRTGTVWSLRPPLLTALDGESSDHFGCSVAFGQDAVFIGSFNGGNLNQGAVYFFESNCLVTVSAASYDGAQLAPESIVAGFGRNLSEGTTSAVEQPLPTTLGDTRVRVFDSLGVRRFAPMFYVSPGQINFQIPAGTASGEGVVIVDRNGIAAAGRVMIASVAPSLFTANATGGGVAAALVFRRKAGGAESYEPVATYDSALQRFVSVPIDLGPETDQVFLLLYGTGIRFRSSLQSISATVGGMPGEVVAAEAVMDYAGLDQVNVRLSRSLAGRGEVDVLLSVDGKAANTVRVNIR